MLSDSDNDELQYPDEQQTETFFYAENVKANASLEIEVEVLSRLRITNIALAGKKADTVISISTAGDEEKFVICHLSSGTPQYQVDMTFGAAESPVVFYSNGAEVTLIGEKEIADMDDDLELGEDESAGDMGEGMIEADDSEEEEAPKKPAGKQPKKEDAKQQPKKEDAKQQPKKEDAKQQPKKEDAKQQQPKKDAKKEQPKGDNKQSNKTPEKQQQGGKKGGEKRPNEGQQGQGSNKKQKQ